MTFKEKIINLRKIRGLTQDEFAKAVGVSRQAVYKWESGQSYPEVPKILEIKLLFNVSIDDLLDDSFDIPLPEKKKRKRAKKSVEQTAPSAEEKKEEAVAEQPAAVAAEGVQNQQAPAAPAQQEVSAAADESPSKEDEASDDKKQRGFFSRLFGRK